MRQVEQSRSYFRIIIMCQRLTEVNGSQISKRCSLSQIRSNLHSDSEIIIENLRKNH